MVALKALRVVARLWLVAAQPADHQVLGSPGQQEESAIVTPNHQKAAACIEGDCLLNCQRSALPDPSRGKSAQPREKGRQGDHGQDGEQGGDRAE
jgi:hypothetical protein